MHRLRDRVAIVTGGGRGIGRAIVELFVAEGGYVVNCDADLEGGEAAVREVNRKHRENRRACFYPVDLGDSHSIKSFVEQVLQQFPPPSILVNNAATVIQKHTGDASLEDYDRTMNVNVRGCWYLAQLIYPYMKQKRYGTIINMASTHPYQTRVNSFPYNASKGAVLAMTKAMAVDFGKDGIRVNALLPGIVDTKSTREWISGSADPEGELQYIIASHPLGRMPTPEDVARAALFLASDESCGITGAELVVDCGRQVKRR